MDDEEVFGQTLRYQDAYLRHITQTVPKRVRKVLLEGTKSEAHRKKEGAGGWRGLVLPMGETQGPDACSGRRFSRDPVMMDSRTTPISTPLTPPPPPGSSKRPRRSLLGQNIVVE
ncbi:unnamed protein product [Arctogadus glacialis]